ncbi:MAG: acyl-ACP--UDP-N-acetylglucosamine O-acyltransferase [bacterium]|nr:acyl-ACP--UDP-N-acetylglucosamine O-acyltransferase [bacterium]
MAKIHPAAIVSHRAELASDVEVDAYSIIEDDVIVGPACRISSCVRLHSGTRLAEGVRVFHGAALGGEPQDLKFTGEKTELNVGANTIIREFVTLSRGTRATGRTRIGHDCMLMAYAHVAHDCWIGDHVILANSVNLAGHVEVGDYAIIGGVVPIHQFVHIGMHCMIGGGFRVPKDVPPFILAAGMPLRYLGLNVVGLRRRGFSPEARTALRQAYHILFSGRLTLSDAVKQIESRFQESDEVKYVLEFISKSKRGLLPGRATSITSEEF